MWRNRNPQMLLEWNGMEWNGNWCSHHGGVWQFLKKLNTELASDPATPLLGKYSRELKTYIQIKIKHECSQQYYS